MTKHFSSSESSGSPVWQARGFTVFSKKIIEALSAGRTTVDGAATFEDGYRAAEVCDAIVRSGQSGTRETVSYRD